MEAGAATARGRMGWRLWAIVPVLLLAIAVGVVVTSGSSLVDLVGTNPPPADEFDIRRVVFEPGEIRIRQASDGHFWVTAEVNGEPVRFLTALSHALSTLGLYGEHHPAVRRAADAAYRELTAVPAT